jgi:hypothetical protein
MTTAYVYKWTHLPTGKWYIGSRSAKGCHPDDGYICSSKTVKPMILEFKNEWLREVIATGTKEKMRELETNILKSLDAKNNSMSFNKHNNDGLRFPNNEGEKNFMFGKNHTQESIEKMSNAGKGKKRSEEARRNISLGHVGISNGPHREETKKKMSDIMKGRPSSKKGICIISNKKYYHNGLVSKKFVPGTELEGFVSGRILVTKKLVATEINVQKSDKGESIKC